MGIPTAAQKQLYARLVVTNNSTAEAFPDSYYDDESLVQTNNNNSYLAKADVVTQNVSSVENNKILSEEYSGSSKSYSESSATSATQAAASAIAAATARDVATLSAGIYATEAAGIAGTTVGKYFSVPSSLNTEYLNLYLHETETTARKIQTYPSVAGLEYSVENTLYISANGSDSNTGTSWAKAFRTIEKALQAATERWNTYNKATLIEWAPESIVYTKGHLDMPDNCVIKAVHRTVFVRPFDDSYAERNVFRMGSGCFLEGVMFEGWRLDSLENPTEGFAVSFRPGAVITRVPYAHKIACRALPTWGIIAPPLDAANANPLVPRAGGVALADGNIISQYSIFPNIMTWGATPVLPNGIGYCAKNGALINAVNAVSIWAHKHFLAQSGGQIILSACSTQFGDYSMVADGGRDILNPTKTYAATNVNNTIPRFTTKADKDCISDLVNPAKQTTLVDEMWTELSGIGYTDSWSNTLQLKTKSDAKLLLQCLYWTLSSGNEQPMLDFAKGMFDVNAKPVYISAAKSSVPITEETGALARRVQNNTSFAAQLKASQDTIADTMWTALVDRVYVSTWTEQDEYYTKRDAKTLLTALERALVYANEQYMTDFVRGLYYTDGSLVIEYQKLPATLYAWQNMKTSVLNLSSVGPTTGNLYLTIEALFNALISNFSFKGDVTFNANSRARAEAKLLSAGVPTGAITGQTLWNSIVAKGYNSYLNNTTDEGYTKRDGETLLTALRECTVPTTGFNQSELPMLDFAYGLYSFFGTSVISAAKMPAVLLSFDKVEQFIATYVTDTNARTVISRILTALKENITFKKLTTFPTSLEAANKITEAYVFGRTDDLAALIDVAWTAVQAEATYFNNNALTLSDATATKNYAKRFAKALAECFRLGSDQPMINFGNQLLISLDVCVIEPTKVAGTLRVFKLLGNQLVNKLGAYSIDVANIITNLESNLICNKNVLPTLSATGIANLKNAAAIIKNYQESIIENTWTALTQDSNVFGTGKLTQEDMVLTKRDTLTLLTAIRGVLDTFTEKPILNFASEMFLPARVPVITGAKIIPTVYSFKVLKDYLNPPGTTTPVEASGSILGNLISNATLNSNKYAFVFCWNFIKKYVRNTINATGSALLKDTADALLDTLNTNVLIPDTIQEPSRITAIGHTWTSVMGGVALTKIPPANNAATIQDSIVESDNGIVIASGQDDQGNALFVGGLQINSDTGELGGPPFDQAVRRVATKTSISRSF